MFPCFDRVEREPKVSEGIAKFPIRSVFRSVVRVARFGARTGARVVVRSVRIKDETEGPDIEYAKREPAI